MTEPLKLLVVEDDPVDAGIIRRVLEQPGLGQSVWTAPSLAEAKAKLRSERYDAVLLDLGLPDSEGLDAVMDMQATVPELPIIVLSGNADPGLALRSVDLGAEDYIVKGQLGSLPMDRSLRYAIERHRRKARLFQDNDALWRSLQAALRESETDPLTGTANRRGLDRHMRGLTEEKALKVATALMIDLDHFKRINDCYGHDLGDAVLRETASRIQGGLVKQDYLARIGGDEFVAVIQRPGRAAAQWSARTVLSHISREPFAWGRRKVPCSATVALVEFVPGPKALEQILAKAHPLLVRGKNGGRARVESAWLESGGALPGFTATDPADTPKEVRSIRSLADGAETGHLFVPSPSQAAGAPHAAGMRTPLWLDGVRWAKQWQDQKGLRGTRHLDMEPDTLPPGFAQDLRTLFHEEERKGCVLYFHAHADGAMEIPLDEIRQLRQLGFQIGVRGLGGGSTQIEHLMRLAPQWIRFDPSSTMDLGRFPDRAESLRCLCSMLAPLRALWLAEDPGDEATLKALAALGFEAYCRL